MTDVPLEPRGINRLLAKIKLALEARKFYEGEVLKHTFFYGITC